MSFHSEQAVWQALQPMHLETSMSLATSPEAGARTLGGGVGGAEGRLMSRDCDDMAAPSDLLDLDQEGLEFGRVRVAVAHEGCQVVGDEALLGDPLEAPVDRDADMVDGLAVDLQRLD